MKIFDKTFSDEDKIIVVTGNNGSGKTRFINSVKENYPDFIVLDTDSHNHLNQNDLKDFIYSLKEKSKTNKIVIASIRKEVIDIANKVIELKSMFDISVKKL